MNKKIKKYCFLIVLCCFIHSCKHKVEKEINPESIPIKVEESTIIEVSNESSESLTSNQIDENSNKSIDKSKTEELKFKSTLRPNENIVIGRIYTDTLQIVEFDTNYDDFYLIATKHKDTVSLIYNKENQKFIKREEFEVQWKLDSIRPAGDPEFLDYKLFATNVKKTKSLELTDKKIKFLWLEKKNEISRITLNKDYIKNISEPEKAALAYIVTFIGNECEWDGSPTENRTNLKCKILWDLGLNYQCSLEHLNLLKYWFRKDEGILNELANCPKKPDGATVNTYFETITIEVKDNNIVISFKASGYHLRLGEHWSWTEKHFFNYQNNELIQEATEVSEKVYK